jgi:antitoxin ParD1/3/4
VNDDYRQQYYQHSISESLIISTGKRSSSENQTAGVMQVTLPPELELIVSRQLTSGKYQNAFALRWLCQIEVIRSAIWQSQRYANELLDKQEDIYRGKLGELQQAASIGWEASQRGEIVDGNIAMDQIRSNLKSRYSK